MKKVLKKISAVLVLASMINSLTLPIADAQPVMAAADYLGFLQEKVNSTFIYPKEALLNGWGGIVKVKFIVSQDGRIKDIDIAESSGYPLLDAVAILAVKDASPYPFPADYPEEDLEIILPINYQPPETVLPYLSDKVVFSELLSSNSMPDIALQDYSAAKTPENEEQSAEFSPVQLAVAESQDKVMEDTLFLAEPPIPPAEGVNPELDLFTNQNEELAYFVDMALKNNQPTKVAQEEIELAQLKLTEAKRNFYPALKLQSYFTDGEVYKVEYEERENKIQVDQPIFYGGRLKDALKQAETNLEITQKNYDRLKLDVVQKTESAYYNLIASRMLIGQQEKLLQEAEEMLKKIEKLSKIGMVIPLELTSAKSWLEQIKFQMDSTKQDLFMAELTFKQVLNTKEIPPLKTKLLQPKRLELEVSSCVEVAMQFRPEIYLSELLVKFNEYGQKIEASKKNAFNIDLTGSYGRYEGAYKTESMRESDNWYIGIKATKPWGGNTINSSFSREETQPRFGQTSATASSTISAELNILDNLKRLSDKKKSDIDLHRSVSDFNETLKTITFEVQDAFLNYQKAVLQLNTAQSEIEFRNSELAISKIRALTGDINLANAMSSLLNFSDALTKYYHALGNYHISIANLRKAVGYGLKI